MQAGCEFDEVLNFGGRKTQTFRVTVFEANKTLEVTAIAGLGIRPTQRYSVSSNAGSTTVSIRVTVHAQGLFPSAGATFAQDDRFKVARLQRATT